MNEDYTLYVTGYNKTIAYWSKIAKEYGVSNIKGYWCETRYKGCSDELELSTDEVIQGLDAVLKADKTLGLFVTSRLGRMAILQKTVESVDAVFIVSFPPWSQHNFRTFGSRYLLQIAIDNRKPIYLYNQINKKWFCYTEENDFTMTEFEGPPKLTKTFACGGAFKLNKHGEKAIEDVFLKTFNNK